MKILKMNAFGDFDSPYDINVCVGEKDRIEKIQNVLNEFCKSLPGCEQDVSLSKYLSDKQYFKDLVQRLVDADCFIESRAKDFAMLVYKKCESGVYVYKDTFSVEFVVEV